MKAKLFLTISALVVLAQVVRAQGTAFTYQGRLTDNGTPAMGNYDLRFAIYDAANGGSQLGNPITNSPVAVSDGTFTVLLDFGEGIFPGANRWLQIGVRTNGSVGAFTTLSPPQAFTVSPYAITAGDVTSANISRLNVPNTATPATGTPTVTSGFITGATLTGGGSGYGPPPTVTVNDTTGSGAVITASISAGAVVGLTVQNPGSGYSSVATMSIAPPPNNASQTFVSPNFFTGVNTMNNPNNTFVGSFTGSGAGLNGIVKRINGLTDAVTLAAGANISLGASGNTITVATAGVLGWQVVSGTAQQALSNTGYLLTNDSQVIVTLPTFPNPGDLVRVSGSGISGWKIAQNAGQSVLTLSLPSYGAIWTPYEVNRNWYSVASSSDGNKLVAVLHPGQIYTSTNSGGTWTPRETDRGWQSVASSADGSKLVAVENGGQIYTSTDSGVSWVPRDSSRVWYSVASSADGSNLATVVLAGQIYTSTDSGASWTPRETNRNWISVASSADGSKLVAVVFGGQIYTSANSGVSWTPRESDRNWGSIASSSGGSKLVALVSGGQIYISTDSGATWIPRDSSRSWASIASSSNGSKTVAVVYMGQIYISASTSAAGTAGYLLGDQDSALELQFVGNGQFIPLSHEGTITAY